MMIKSYDILKDHPVNKARVSRGLRPPIPYGFGEKAKNQVFQNFTTNYKLNGSVISAVDLIKGIGILAGFRNVEVEGATGNIDTNFYGKAQAALRSLNQGRTLYTSI